MGCTVAYCKASDLELFSGSRVALSRLAIAFWLSRIHTHTVMLKAMLAYNSFDILLLVYADYYINI